jgi:hypothetical protein
LVEVDDTARDDVLQSTGPGSSLLEHPLNIISELKNKIET